MGINLKIEYSSPYELEQVIRTHPEVEDEAYRLYSEAYATQREVELELEILVAEIVDDICKSKHVPPSAKSEVRRVEVPLDPRYKKMVKKCIEAEKNTNILRGAMKSASARGYCLTQIGNMTLKTMGGSITIKDEKHLNYDVSKTDKLDMDFDKEMKDE